ncbi:RS28 [Hepatospora eriocheir]|uniref:RS28 n=1 Tax=Hepatospora eriocheir TaxID=1081669 RepID=A0A1X0Q9U5_9MICR|nr:RS28 [Hepatospora eriocheir]
MSKDNKESDVVQEKAHLAKVISVHKRSGAGGGINQCKVELVVSGKQLQRAITGPVKAGHYLYLNECVREIRIFGKKNKKNVK